MRHAIEQRLAQALRFLREPDLGGEMLAFLQLRRQAPHRERNDEVSGEGECILKLLDMQGEERRDEKKVPGKRTHGGDQQSRPAAQDHSSEENPKKEEERDRVVTDQPR